MCGQIHEIILKKCILYCVKYKTGGNYEFYNIQMDAKRICSAGFGSYIRYSNK